MKELSIEEKAKAYDEAVEVAKKYHNGTLKDVMETIFPELKESEGGIKDERIRKAVISTFKPHCCFYEVSVDEVLAWFEKRFSKSRQKEIDDAYLKGICDAKQELEKQGEQKYVELFDIPENSIGNDLSVMSRMENISKELKPIANFILEYSHWNLHKDEWNHPVPEVPLFRVLDALVQKGKSYQGACCCVEQKPAEWSEDDELMLVSIIQTLKLTNGAAQMKIDWLNAVKCRVGSKVNCTTARKWSGEDEELCEHLIKSIEELDPLPTSIYSDCKRWLKNLKDRYSWMPSEEYIDLINEAIGFFGAHSAKGMLMMDLRNNLNKLREE